MRKLLALAAAVMLICAMAVGVSAETGATSVTAHATVSNDGSCQVTLTAMIHLEQSVEALQFPLPLEAKSITLNGSRVGAKSAETAKLVSLSGITGSIAGDFSVTLTYRLDNVVFTDENELLQLQMPLLSGFAYPVEHLEFTVTLPAAVNTSPAFSSGYHQANIEKDLDYTVSGSMISGTSNKRLKDHETLTMILPVSEEVFPQTKIELPDLDATNTLMIASAVLALLYWLLCLRNALPRFWKVSTPPDGYSAGQLHSVLSMQGADLTMMVFTWAQLGYLQIRQDRHGRVTLHKRMDMGNERSSFEQRCFKNLFSKRSDAVDTTGYHYALQWQKINKMPPNIHGLIHPKSGSPYVFRGLAALVGLFGGAGLGISLGTGAVLQWLVVVLMAAFGAVSSWHMSRWAESLYVLGKRRLWTALILSGIWILVGIFAGTVGAAVGVVAAQLLSGLMATFGGRRTEAGKQAMWEVLGLRRYLRTVPRNELSRIMQSNPEYFHTVAPYALALGTDQAFAKRFGGERLPTCPYLDIPTEAKLTASQWSQTMRAVANAMDTRRRKLPQEKLLGIFQSFLR